MNKRQKELLKLQLKDEREVQRNLKIIYQQALEDIDAELLRLRGSDQTQSKVYRVRYQKQLREQVSNTLDEMNKQQGIIISDHLKNAYKRSFIGTMYDFHGQGVPFLFPVDGKQITKALFTNSKIKEGLYKKLGKDTRVLKRQIANEITRGIASGKSYHDITRNLNLQSQIGLGKANRIVRTEGHRIQNEAAHDAGRKAHENGADVVKQWDATLDGNTRPSHRVLDGQLRELDEPFSLNGKEADYPGAFGIPAEDINCRCAILHRAKWALDGEELERLKDRAEQYGLDKSSDFEDFQEKYMGATELNIPMVWDGSPPSSGELKMFETFTDTLKNSKGVETHVVKMLVYNQLTNRKLDNTLAVPYQYDSKLDVIKYNPNAKYYDLVDPELAMVHELSHRMDILEYDVISNKEFVGAVELSKKKVMGNKDEIQQWFIDGGKYEKDMAVSDIISALSKNEIEVNIGHKTEYWEIPGMIEREIFSNISSMDILDDPGISDLKPLLNELFDAYEGVVK